MAACEVPPHADEAATLELAVDVVREAVPGLAARRRPGPEEGQHDPLDTPAWAIDADPYDLVMASGPKPDAELVRLAQGGDLDAFAEIVSRYEGRLRLVLLRILDDSRDVEEAVQDTFVQAWRGLASYRGESALFTWLYRVGVNAALGRARKVRATVVELNALDAHPPRASDDVDPARAAEAADLRAQVLAALDELPLDYREAVVLRDLAGLSNAEVAEALGVGLAAAKSRVHRGRMRLRELLEPHLP